ncbi:hypothetical protein MHC_06014 [Mycoplasma haemocanis str. Illinois]|uniref:Uncharacterized protein n=1 Tax=Mycoplasma haemocanis (strain Illinois) TaxID=1111676 RepID=I6QQZ1_MYCHN|nr:hypothetical protein MHC_06014 [Mycoplasma haemocanis str. Illinois]
MPSLKVVLPILTVGASASALGGYIYSISG